MARVNHLRKASEVEERWARLRAGEAALASLSGPGPARTGTVPDFDVPTRSFPTTAIPSPSSIRKEQEPPHAVALTAVPWRPVFDAYAAEARLAPSTIKRWSGVMAALEDEIGTDDLAAVTPEFLLGWKASLLASGRSPGTVRDAYLGSIKAVMNWAVANRRLAANPVLGISVWIGAEA